MRNLYINTIGCQMNVYDSARIAALLRPRGYQLTDSLHEADLVVLNTCAIREKAEQKAFSFLGRLAGLKRKNPQMIIAVGGCVAQQEGKDMLRRVPFLDVIFGTSALPRLPRLIEKVLSGRTHIVDVDTDAVENEFDTPLLPPSAETVSQFVTIMQGCDNYCTYCVVPYVRGRERSRKPESIVREIEEMVRCGIREVTLLGQNVNSYGKKEGLCSFAQLIARIGETEGLYRIRFTTSHPKDVSPELITAFRGTEKLCRHIHLPVQSGSNEILRRMNRRYTREHYLDVLDRLRRACPEIAVTSDLIVGFPGESRADFEKTLDLMRSAEFDGLFAFKYSDRPNAPAARFSDKVPEKEQNDRLQQLLELQEQFTVRKNRALIGSIQEVLVDGVSRRSAPAADFSGDSAGMQWSGRTSENKIVNFIPEDSEGIPPEEMMGKLLHVRVEEACSHSLRGKMITFPADRRGEETNAA